MTRNPQILYKKIENISESVLKNLRSKGVVVPVENLDGTVSIGRYIICKKDNFYHIKNSADEILVDKINLPQTAIIIANDLALNKFLDNQTVQLDRNYGYALFEEILYKKNSKFKKNFEEFDIALTKVQIAKAKKESNRKAIMVRFEKLRKLV